LVFLSPPAESLHHITPKVVQTRHGAFLRTGLSTDQVGVVRPVRSGADEGNVVVGG
jgi:hypothetical protein